MNLVLAAIFGLVGILFALLGRLMVVTTYRQFPLFGKRRPIGQLIPRRKCVVEGFARAEPVLRAPLTGKPCIAWEARGFVERTVHTQNGTRREWKSAGPPVGEALAFHLEDEDARASVAVPVAAGLTFAGFGEADTEHFYNPGQNTELHQAIGMEITTPTMIKMWMLDRLDQCTVVGIAGVGSDGSSLLHGLPVVGGKVVVVHGSAANATRKVLLTMLGWLLTLLVGIALLAGAIALLIFQPIR